MFLNKFISHKIHIKFCLCKLLAVIMVNATAAQFIYNLWTYFMYVFNFLSGLWNYIPSVLLL